MKFYLIFALSVFLFLFEIVWGGAVCLAGGVTLIWNWSIEPPKAWWIIFSIWLHCLTIWYVLYRFEKYIYCKFGEEYDRWKLEDSTNRR